jgi:peptidoglycan L-alanyl-D-glutamate endopeptidase CwlK
MRELTIKEIVRYKELRPELQRLFDLARPICIAVYEFDLFLVCGHRSKEEQDLVFNRGFSKVKWPNSKHNSLPSEAMDTCPYPIDWNNLQRFRQMYEILNLVAQENGMKIRFGADFNMNGNLKDDKFVDLPHCELLET